MTEKKYKWGMLMALAITMISCQGSKSQEKWTKHMQITTYNGGGRVPESKTVIIKDSSGLYIHWANQKKDTFNFSLSQPELDDLMNEINADRFRTINSGETGSIAYDKPTTSVEFKWENKTHEVAIGATEAIKGDDSGFYKLYNYILSLAVKKTGQASD